MRLKYCKYVYSRTKGPYKDGPMMLSYLWQDMVVNGNQPDVMTETQIYCSSYNNKKSCMHKCIKVSSLSFSSLLFRKPSRSIFSKGKENNWAGFLQRYTSWPKLNSRRLCIDFGHIWCGACARLLISIISISLLSSVINASELPTMMQWSFVSPNWPFLPSTYPSLTISNGHVKLGGWPTLL